MLDFNIWEVIFNKPFIAAIIAQASSQFIKIFLPILEGKPPDIKRFTDYGGIPSAHTAFIVGVTCSIGLTEGWSSSLFALAVVVAAILISDIMRVRPAVESNKRQIERLLKRPAACAACGWRERLNGCSRTYSDLDDFLLLLTDKDDSPQFKSHTTLEIIIGGIWGIICSVFVCLLLKV